MRINWTINDPIKPGGKRIEEGMGIKYSQFSNSDRWLRSNKLSDMTFRFKVKSVIYADGTQEKF